MNSFLWELASVSLVVGVASFVSYGGKGEGAMRSLLSLILVLTLISPCVNLISEIFSDSFSSLEWEADVDTDGTVFSQVAEEAYCEGLRKYVSETFEVEYSETEISVEGFDVNLMKAERIVVVLSGKSVLCDHRLIAERVGSEFNTKCEVEKVVT